MTLPATAATNAVHVSRSSVHDIGGLDFGPIDRHEHDLALWEKRVDAMMIILYARKGAFKVDAMRRVIESYTQQTYDRIGYYDKWVKALAVLCVEQELFSAEELDAAVAGARHDMMQAGRSIATDAMS